MGMVSSVIGGRALAWSANTVARFVMVSGLLLIFAMLAAVAALDLAGWWKVAAVRIAVGILVTVANLAIFLAATLMMGLRDEA